MSAASRERLIGWMVACDTGLDRLRAGLPADWRTGDRTGAGGIGAINDLAVSWPPGRPPVVIAACTSEGAAATAARVAALAETGALVAQAWG